MNALSIGVPVASSVSMTNTTLRPQKGPTRVTQSATALVAEPTIVGKG